MNGIVGTLLNELYQVRLAIGVVEHSIEDTPLGQELKGLQNSEASLEKAIKAKAKFCSGTVAGNNLQVVLTERSTWDSEKLQALADAHGITPAELEACKDTSKVWSIRKVASK